MKKITFMVLGMAAMIAVSCGEKKDAPKEGEATTTEQTAETPAETPAEAPAATGYDAALDKYAKIADEHIALLKKINAGDVAAATEAIKVTEELAKVGEELQKTDPTTITKEQAAKYQAIADKYQKALLAK